jgi:catechol 1,2-dioxygenase
MDHELGGRAYVVSVMDNHSRYILSSALTRSQDLSSYLAVLYAAVERYGWPTLGESTTMHNQATVFVDQRGEYRLESNVPVSYGGRPPHIHVRVRAPGYEELVTQHYPERGQRKANFDLVLVAE